MAIRVEGASRAKVSARWVTGVAKRARGALGRTKDELAVVFVAPEKIKKLNAAYRKKDRTTDTLSFPSDAPGDLGDIFIAPAVAKMRAREKGMDERAYLALLIVHGVLHLGGYDHHTAKESAAMGKMEDRILKSC